MVVRKKWRVQLEDKLKGQFPESEQNHRAERLSTRGSNIPIRVPEREKRK